MGLQFVEHQPEPLGSWALRMDQDSGDWKIGGCYTTCNNVTKLIGRVCGLEKGAILVFFFFWTLI